MCIHDKPFRRVPDIRKWITRQQGQVAARRRLSTLMSEARTIFVLLAAKRTIRWAFSTRSHRSCGLRAEAGRKCRGVRRFSECRCHLPRRPLPKGEGAVSPTRRAVTASPRCAGGCGLARHCRTTQIAGQSPRLDNLLLITNLWVKAQSRTIRAEPPSRRARASATLSHHRWPARCSHSETIVKCEVTSSLGAERDGHLRMHRRYSV